MTVWDGILRPSIFSSREVSGFLGRDWNILELGPKDMLLHWNVYRSSKKNMLTLLMDTRIPVQRFATSDTPQKTNMDTQNDGWKKVASSKHGHCWYVKFQGETTICTNLGQWYLTIHVVASWLGEISYSATVLWASFLISAFLYSTLGSFGCWLIFSHWEGFFKMFILQTFHLQTQSWCAKPKESRNLLFLLC